MKDRNNIHKVVVLDMQPIFPPVGGGRMRLLGLYHGLGEKLPTTYIGTYDWPGEKFRKHRLSDTLEEIDIPLSTAHFEISEKWKTFAGGQTIINTAFPLMAPLSHKFIDNAKSVAKKADIVILSHPWVYPLVRDVLDDVQQLIVYDSQNFEGMLQTELLDDNGFGTEIAKHVVVTEYELANCSDIVIACSKYDGQLFNEIYGVDYKKLREVPNGVFSKLLIPPTSAQKESAKKSFNLTGQVAIFIGSPYGPNIKAVEFICNKLAPSLPDLTFVICGGVADAIELKAFKMRGRKNVRYVGFVTEKEKLKYLWASDIAINPMFSGSGTNIKMFDFMAAGLPTVTTPVGARGINVDPHSTLIISGSESFTESIGLIINNKNLARQFGERARDIVEKKYSWERISPNLGCILKEALIEKRQSHPVIKKNANVYVESSLNYTKWEPIKTDSSNKSIGTQPNIFAETKTQIALLTPWGIPCGIAEYSKYLVDSLNRHNVKCLLLTNINRDSKNCVPKNKMSSSTAIEEIWQYGNIKAEDVVNICRNASINKLNIQYNVAFFNEESLIDVVSECIEASIDVSITFHNTKIMEVGSLLKIGDMGTLLIVHNIDELKRLSSLGVKGLSHVPHGVLEVPDEPAMALREQLGISSSPVIGSFGFLRPHKGLMELIRATAILLELFPNIVLFTMNALYPSEDSEKYLIECNDCINSLGLTNHIRLDTQFLEIEHLIGKLHVCDLIVLPYHHSNEGASGSVNIAIAAKRPVLTTREEIFKECSDVIYQVEGNAPHILSAGISSVLSSPMFLRSLKRKPEKYIETNSWNSVADKYSKLILKQ